MAKQINVLHNEKLTINLNHCVVYYKSKMIPRAWESLYSSVLNLDCCRKFNSKNPATAVVFISSNLILVI